MTKKIEEMQPARLGKPNLSHLISHGFPRDSVKRAEKMLEKIVCPKCKFGFSKLYARAISCQGCIKAARGCRMIRCPKCDHEFYIGRSLDFYSKLHTEYYKTMGWPLNR